MRLLTWACKAAPPLTAASGGPAAGRVVTSSPQASRPRTTADPGTLSPGLFTGVLPSTESGTRPQIVDGGQTARSTMVLSDYSAPSGVGQLGLGRVCECTADTEAVNQQRVTSLPKLGPLGEQSRWTVRRWDHRRLTLYHVHVPAPTGSQAVTAVLCPARFRNPRMRVGGMWRPRRQATTSGRPRSG